MVRDMGSTNRLFGLVLSTAVSWTGVAEAGDPEAPDPILDGIPTGDPLRRDPLPKYDTRAPGFMMAASGGIYFGKVSSRLEGEVSRLDSGMRAFAGFGLGYRTAGPIELGLDLALGLGETWESKYEIQVFSVDLLVQPRILVHLYETPTFGLYTGVAAEAIAFDVESAGINQAGVGPAAILGLLTRTDRYSLFYLELSGSYFNDLLAFRFEDPSPEALLEDPALEAQKIEGAWYGIYRVIFGYRLSSF